MSYIGNSSTTQTYVAAIDYFNGNGVTVAFTLSRPVATSAQVQVTIENVPQNPGSAFSIVGSTITFTSAPPAGTSNIYVYYTSPVTQVIAPSTGSVQTSSLGDITAINSATTLSLKTGGTAAVTVDASQNVGIGGTPTEKLQVFGASNVRFKLTESGSGVSCNILQQSVSSYLVADTQWIHYTNGAERMRIDASGNVLVGTTSIPTGGGIGVGFQTDSAGAFITRRTNTTSSNTAVYFLNPNGFVGSINTSGSATSYVTSSDYRLKENIVPMVGALDKVLQLKPVTYAWKQDGSDGQGFIAHELQAILPDAVVGEKDAVDADGNPKYQGVDTSFLVATLTAAIQEQQAIINDLKARIETLEAK